MIMGCGWSASCQCFTIPIPIMMFTVNPTITMSVRISATKSASLSFTPYFCPRAFAHNRHILFIYHQFIKKTGGIATTSPFPTVPPQTNQPRNEVGHCSKKSCMNCLRASCLSVIPTIAQVESFFNTLSSAILKAYLRPDATVKVSAG